MDTWLSKTIFSGLKDRLSMHTEPGFSLMLVHDPKRKCAHQSRAIHVDEEYVCASDCILYNKNELAEALGISVQASNERIIISSLKKWGKLFADKFDGKFSFVLWDRKHGKLLGARDALGYGNLCYSRHNGTLYFSSDLATLLDQPLVDKSVNRKRFYQCFRYANNLPHQTYFEQCDYCPPSHILEFENTVSTTDYWCLSTRKSRVNDVDEVTNCKRYITLLTRAINNECDENSRLGLMLSGGLDSSLLASITAENKALKATLTCYSNIFEHHKSCDESHIINQTANKLNLDSIQINCDGHYVFSDLPGRTIVKDIINLDGYCVLPEAIFNRAGRDGKTLLIMGHFGDDLFGGNRFKFADLILHRDFSSILNMLNNSESTGKALNELINFGIRPLLPDAVKKFYRRFVKPGSQDNLLGVEDDQINTIDDFMHINDQTFHRQNLLKLVYLTNTAEGIYYYRKHLYLGHGLKYVMPYYSKAMIEFFWNLPICQLNRPNNHRWLQRQSLTMLGLEHVAADTDKTEFMALYTTGITEKRTILSQMIDSSSQYDQIKLPEKLMEKMKSARNIEIDEAVLINQYLSAALWWQAVEAANGSFNQPVMFSFDCAGLQQKIKDVWSVNR